MTGSRLHGLWLKARVTVYIGIVAAILLTRFLGVPWRGLKPPASGVVGGGKTLVLSGVDLAPGLIARLGEAYRRDYADLALRFLPGGTTRGLEDLANRRADVAFLSRPPTAEEQRLVAAAARDTLLWFPVALGGLVLLRGAQCPVTTLDVAGCRALLAAADSTAPRLYAPDPNTGAWEAFLGRLGAPALDAATPRPGVTFLKDQAAVVEALRAAPGALGLVSGLGFPEGFTAAGVDTVALRAAADAPPARPTDDAVARGDYPLYHYLYVACRPHESIRGTMFVTHLTSDRGQRQVERAGYLPARHPMREIALTKNPLGKTGR